jgi:NAD(P)H-flavin reductase
VRGPFGRGWRADARTGQRARDVVIVAGGLGLAPVRPIVYDILARRGDYGRVMLIIGARTPADLLYTTEYGYWREAGLEVSVTVDRADRTWTGHTGLVTGPLVDAGIDGGSSTAYLCGPEVMMTAAAEVLVKFDVPAERIVLSLERSMKCAMGTCGHCQLGPDLLCRTGPCVTYEHAEPLLAVKEL